MDLVCRWIRVQKFTWTVNAAGAPTLTSSEANITAGLTHPRALAFGGPQGNLYVADVDAPESDTAGKLHGVIKRYDVSGTPALVEQFGTMQQPGAVTATTSFGKGNTGITPP